ncbi:MAG: porin family protein [Chitinispirillaceae bacterium]
MKHIPFIILILIASAPLAGDMDYILKEYGIKGGVSIANQKFTIEPESQLYHIVKGGKFKYRPGFTGGIYAEWFNEPYINLVTELNYVQKGTIFNTGGATWTEYNNRMDYLSLPVMAKLKYPDIKYLPYLLFGIRYDYLLNRHIKSDVLLYDKAKKGNLGISMGLGYQFDAGGFPLLVEYSYHSQYATLLEEDQYEYTVRNLSHSLVLGYRFKALLKPDRQKRSKTEQKSTFSFEDPLLRDNKENSSAPETQKKNNHQMKEISAPGLTKQALVFRSLLLPGSAHFSTKRYISGTAYTLLFAGALYFSYNRIENYNRMVDDWQSELNKLTPETLFYDTEQIQERCNNLKNKIDSHEKAVYYSLAGLTAIYLANVFDAVLFAPEDQLRITINPQITDEKTKVTLAVELDL